jgi:hypothetical protein
MSPCIGCGASEEPSPFSAEAGLLSQKSFVVGGWILQLACMLIPTFYTAGRGFWILKKNF